MKLRLHRIFFCQVLIIYGTYNSANSAFLRLSSMACRFPLQLQKAIYSRQMFLSPASNFRISVLLGIFPLPKSRYGPTLQASVASRSESFPNCWNIAQNFRRSFRRSASACRFVMVRAEYLSPGCNRCLSEFSDKHRYPNLDIILTLYCK